MAVTTTNTPSIVTGLSTVGTRFIEFLGRIGEASSLARSAQARGEQIERLQAKTDEELAAMGLRREDIVMYVFRDLMYV